AGDGRRAQAGEGGHRVLLRGEGGEDQVEPDYVRPDLTQRLQNAPRVRNTVELPAADYVEVRQLFADRNGIAAGISGVIHFLQLISQDREADERVLLQLARKMMAVFVQLPPAGRKCSHQTDLHGPPGS